MQDKPNFVETESPAGKRSHKPASRKEACRLQVTAQMTERQQLP